MKTPMKSCVFEARARARGAEKIAGVDEVGRGPLVGPVVAAAVVLSTAQDRSGLHDSKKLSPKKRMRLAEELKQHNMFGIGVAEAREIEQLNIHRATLLAMRRAVLALQEPPDHLLIDGKFAPEGLNIPHNCIVKGDQNSHSIAAASIIAKTFRDQWMKDLARLHPGYGWERNMGYPTQEHREALLRLGPTLHHRKSYAPVKNVIARISSGQG